MTDVERLARQCGRIAAAFHALPEDEAAEAIAAHINQFWAPAMRRDLLRCFGPGGDAEAELAPRVRRAVALVRRPAVRAGLGGQ